MTNNQGVADNKKTNKTVTTFHKGEIFRSIIARCTQSRRATWPGRTPPTGLANLSRALSCRGRCTSPSHDRTQSEIRRRPEYPRYRRPWKGVSAQRYVYVDPESEEGPGIPPKSGALERHFLADKIEDLSNVIHR